MHTSNTYTAKTYAVCTHPVFSAEEAEELKHSTSPIKDALYAETLEEARTAKYGGCTEPVYSLLLLAFGFFSTEDPAYCIEAQNQIKNHAVQLRRLYNAAMIDAKASPASSHPSAPIPAKFALPLAEHCVALAFGLSLFYDVPDIQMRSQYLEMVLENGILPLYEDWICKKTRLYTLNTVGGGRWFSVASACAASIVLLYTHLPNTAHKNEQAVPIDLPALLANTVDSLHEWFLHPMCPLAGNDKPGCFCRDQNIADIDCAVYAYLRFAVVYKHQFGHAPFEDQEWLSRAADLFSSAAFRTKQNKNAHLLQICTSGSPTVPTDAVASPNVVSSDAALHAPLFLMRYGIQHEGLHDDLKTSENLEQDKLMRLLAWNAIYEIPAQKPMTHVFCSMPLGWWIYKSASLTRTDNTLLAITCGTKALSYADAGHFLLFHDGKQALFHANPASDTEHPRPCTASYNVLRFETHSMHDGIAPCNNDDSPSTLPQITEVIPVIEAFSQTETEHFYHVSMNISCTSRDFLFHKRHILLLDSIALLFDDAVCREAGWVSYLLHTANQSCHRMLTFCDVTAETDAKTDVTTLAFHRSTDARGHVRFLSLLQLCEAVPYTFDENIPDWVLSIGAYQIYIKRDLPDTPAQDTSCENGLVCMGGCDTDAQILILKHAQPYAVVDATLVRHEGITLLDSLTPVTCTL